MDVVEGLRALALDADVPAFSTHTLSYSFFEQCPHRMACARCDFYLPKDSSRGQLEANQSLQRMLVEIPLTDDEQAAVAQDQAAVAQDQAAVAQDQAAVAHLIDALADTPTPAGPTPRDLTHEPTGGELPMFLGPVPGGGRDE